MLLTTRKWIDLGDFGQHEAEIVAHIDIAFPFIEIVEITKDGDKINVAKLLPRDIEADMLTEIELERDIGILEDIADRKRDERMAA